MNYTHIYFLGVGGIGMSALARYLLHEGCHVAGYDRTLTPLTQELSEAGAFITDDEAVEAIPSSYLDPAHTLVVYTPAIPANHPQLLHFTANGFTIQKRSQMLGEVAQGKYVMAVAGTHGKSSTVTLVAWLNHIAGGGGSAFLGGIAKNFGSNLVLGAGDRLAVEADEFDRSFLQLSPNAAVITSVDPDHLDIYGTYEAVKASFSDFIARIKPDGVLILKEGISLTINHPSLRTYRYACDTPSDFYAANLTLTEGGYYRFDLVCPDRTITNCTLGIPGRINIENAVAACALLWVAGFDETLLREALASFRGVKRRFDFHINTPSQIYMDDYAHHPEELRAAITSFQLMFPERSLVAIFQPHLYTRTRDLYEGFAEALSLADEVWLLPIYPAREEPIEEVTSELILKKIEPSTPATIVTKEELLERIATQRPDTLVTFGAGDIDTLCQPITDLLQNR